MKTKLFVVLPVYKGDKLDFIKLSVESILNQTFKEFILLIVKDGLLTTEQENYLSSLSDTRLQYLQLKQNKGLPVALNIGVKEALSKGAKYIARMDADDIALPKRFEKQINYLEEYLDIEILGTPAELIDEKGNVIGNKKVRSKISFEDMLKNCELIHPSVIFRSAFFEKYGFYDEKLLKSQDYDLWLRALNKGAVVHNLQEILLQFRYEIEIISRRKKEQDYNIEIKRKYLKGIDFYKSISRHLLIKYLPNFVIKFLLKRKIK